MFSVKIGIGTVQFGIDYGISNRFPKTPPQEVARILNFAHENGISYLDTAPTYGNSEEIIGQNLSSCHSFKIITKTPVFTKQRIATPEILHLEATLLNSLKRLGQDFVYAILVHRSDNFFFPGSEQLVETLRTLKRRGLVQKVGVSVYDGKTIDKILSLFTPDIIQLPLSPFDQRLLQSGHVKKLKSLGIEIHARSIFLQGLLLMAPEKIPPYFAPVQREIQNYHRFLNERKLTPLKASVGFAAGVKELDSFICGVCNLQQLEEITTAADSSLDLKDFSKFALENEFFLNPTLWKLA